METHIHSPIIAFSWKSCVPKPAYRDLTLLACAGPKLGNKSNAYCVAFAVSPVL
jgi:hypothetical protein